MSAAAAVVLVMKGFRFPVPPAECILDIPTGIVALRFAGEKLPKRSDGGGKTGC